MNEPIDGIKIANSTVLTTPCMRKTDCKETNHRKFLSCQLAVAAQSRRSCDSGLSDPEESMDLSTFLHRLDVQWGAEEAIIAKVKGYLERIDALLPEKYRSKDFEYRLTSLDLDVVGETCFQRDLYVDFSDAVENTTPNVYGTMEFVLSDDMLNLTDVNKCVLTSFEVGIAYLPIA